MCYKLISLIITITFLSSCKSLRHEFLYEEHGKSTIAENLNNLNGCYSNCPNAVCFEGKTTDTDKSMNPPLADMLLVTRFGTNESGKAGPYHGEIGIEVLSKQEIKVTSFVDGTKSKTKIYKGKFINNYFSINQERFFFAIPPLVYTYQVHKVDIGLTAEGDLVVYLSYYSFGGIFVFMGESIFGYEVFFKKLE
ncbi:MAG: hypothetical protein LBD45_08765 [Bacteroidales bacterium]|jgi:hypothetical protein|nr:hypothetical protein [Bacteroidales bacterium]